MSRSPGQTLEAALVANPDDLGAHAAYADWLLEQGDPRGEFIQVQLALEDEKRPADERRRLAQRELELLDQHERTWLGELAPFLLDGSDANAALANGFEHSWSRGWLDALQVPGIDVALGRRLAEHAGLRLLRRLRIGWILLEGPDAPEDRHARNPAHYPGLSPLQHSAFLTNVREFEFGDPEEESRTVGVVALLGVLPRLEKARLRGTLSAADANALARLQTLLQLRELELLVDGDFELDALAGNASLARLTRLRISADGNLPVGLGPEGVRCLLRPCPLKRLRHLQFGNCHEGDTVCRFLAKKGLSPRLRTLGLLRSGITDRGARWLARCPDLDALERLDLTDNYLTARGIDALQESFAGDLEVGGQRAPGAEDAFEGVME